MNKILLRENRQLIPRWHTSRKAYKFQFPSMDKPTAYAGLETKDFYLDEAIDLWDRYKTITNAIDLFIRLKQTDQFDIKQYSEVRQFLEQKKALLNPAVSRILMEETNFADKSLAYAIQNNSIGGNNFKIKKTS